MVAPGIQLSATPVLEQYIKDGKLLLPFSFPFHRQPIKGLYQFYRSIARLVALPSWMLRYALRGWRPRSSWTLGKTVIVRRYCIGGFQFAYAGLLLSLFAQVRFIRWQLDTISAVGVAGREHQDYSKIPIDQIKDHHSFVLIPPAPSHLVVGDISNLSLMNRSSALVPRQL